MLHYHASDERPAWQATVKVNGAADDLSTGHTFEVKVGPESSDVASFTKTSNITGAASGVVTVAWAPNELALTPGKYWAQLKVTRSSDSTEFTITETLNIKTRR